MRRQTIALLALLLSACTSMSIARAEPASNMPRGFEWTHWGMLRQQVIAASPIELQPKDTDFHVVALRSDGTAISRPTLGTFSAVLSGVAEFAGQTVHVDFAFDTQDQLIIVAIKVMPGECQSFLTQWSSTVEQRLDIGSGIWIKRQNAGEGTQIEFTSTDGGGVCRLDFLRSNVLY